jgi:hypothetical protein
MINQNIHILELFLFNLKNSMFIIEVLSTRKNSSNREDSRPSDNKFNIFLGKILNDLKEPQISEQRCFYF